MLNSFNQNSGDLACVTLKQVQGDLQIGTNHIPIKKLIFAPIKNSDNSFQISFCDCVGKK